MKTSLIAVKKLMSPLQIKSKIILGKFAIGEAEIEEIGSSVKDYHEEDDYEPQEISSTVNEKKHDNEF
ncbi:hypothetical protein LNO23_08475 [Klebsiella pneumoniae subsp. pneumoniae]|nr:hypothetical protein [Klebsiella pneumoniae subsp. pneumoniae]